MIFLAALIAVVAVIYGSGSSMTSCVFCDIVSKKAETELLYEDEVKMISMGA